jgi:malate synthase
MIEHGGIQVARELNDFIENEALPGTGLSSGGFWKAFDALLNELAPRNRALLEKRTALQRQIDDWYKARRGQPVDVAAQRAMLEEIGYLVPEGPAFEIGTAGVDDEIARAAGPQLVVPVMNARYALNAANARWGSLYDAAYGTDVVPEDGGLARGDGFNPARGEKVIAFARDFLDRIAPLTTGSHDDATLYAVEGGALTVRLKGGAARLADPAAFAGYRGDADAPDSVLLVHNGLHAEIVIDRSHPIGKTDAAGVADLLLESALTTIQDCEDSVAAVDAEDKVLAYRNWLGLMNGSLSARFSKGGETVERRLSADREYTAAPRRWRFPTPCSPVSRTRWAWPAIPSRWASWTRSGAPPSTSRNASAPPRTGWCSSIPASSTAPATRCTPPWKPGR